MKNFKKSGIALVMALVFILSPLKTYAAELPTEAVYDLEKGGTQTFIIQDEDGEIAEVVIEEIQGNSRIANGNYKVTYDQTGIWNAGFHVSISNNKICLAYNPFISLSYGTVIDDVLNLNSSTKATYGFLYKQLALYYNSGVVATMNGTELIVSKV